MAAETSKELRARLRVIGEAWSNGDTDAKQLYRTGRYLLAALDREEKERACTHRCRCLKFRASRVPSEFLCMHCGHIDKSHRTAPPAPDDEGKP